MNALTRHRERTAGRRCPTNRLEGKSALVTGAASGIGRAAGRLFAAEGARLTLCDVNEEAGEAVAAAIRSEGGEARFVAADVAEPAAVESLEVTGAILPMDGGASAV